MSRTEEKTRERNKKNKETRIDNALCPVEWMDVHLN